jgi:urease accessory protein UreH
LTRPSPCSSAKSCSARDILNLDSARPQLDLSFVRRGARTTLDRRGFRWPFVLTRTFALDPHPRHMLTVFVQSSAGALHGEDRLSQRLAVGENAAAHVTTPGASPVHRANPGVESRENVTLRAAAGACLEYLPEPRILYPDAALEQTVDIDCSEGGSVLTADAFTVHDPSGAGHSFRRFRSSTTLRCDGRSCWSTGWISTGSALERPQGSARSRLLCSQRPDEAKPPRRSPRNLPCPSRLFPVCMARG